MEKQVLYLSAKSVMIVLGVSIATANRRIKEVKNYFIVEKYKRITLSQLCQFLKLDEEKIKRNF
jgi:Fic family protein